MSRHLVKYLFYSFSKARNKKLSNELIFFLQLKQIRPNGYIEGRNKLKLIQTHTTYSKGQISNLFNKLIELGWVEVWKRDDGVVWRYNIKSIKTIYQKLGFKFTKHRKGKYKKNNNYRFTSINLLGLTKKQIKETILLIELQRNSQDQTYRETQKAKKTIHLHLKEITKLKEQKENIQQQEYWEDFNESLIQSYQQEIIERHKEIESIKCSLKETTEGSESQESINKNTISLKNMAKLIGYKSIASTFNFVKALKKEKKFSVKKGGLDILAKGVRYLTYIMNPKLNISGSFWHKGIIYKQNCNSYFFYNTSVMGNEERNNISFSKESILPHLKPSIN